LDTINDYGSKFIALVCESFGVWNNLIYQCRLYQW